MTLLKRHPRRDVFTSALTSTLALAFFALPLIALPRHAFGAEPLPCPAPEAPPEGMALQPGRVFFQAYGSDRGLLTLTEHRFGEDAEGFLWTGAQEGLFRYDGARFEAYGLKEGLPSAYISSIFTSKAGRFLIGTWNGLAVREGDRFRALSDPEGLPPTIVHAIAEDPEGRAWVSSKGGLFREASPGRFEPSPGFPGGEAGGLWIDPDGTVYVGRDGAVDEIRTSGERRTFGADVGLTPGPVVSIVRDAVGVLWMHSRSRLWAMGASGKVEDRSCLLPTASSEGEMTLGRAGDVLIPTARGVLRIGPGGTELINRRRGLPTDDAFAAFEDQLGSLWIASVGVYRLRGRGLWTAYTMDEGLPNNVVYSITRGTDGRLWIGTDDGMARALGGSFRVVPGTEGHSFRALDVAPDGAIWGGGSPGKLLRVDPTTLAIQSYGVADGLKGAQIMGFRRDRAGRFWVGMRSGGLYLGVPQGPDGRLQFKPYSLPGGAPEEEIDWITLDDRGRIWIAGDRGLALLDGESARRFTTADGLRGDHVSAVIRRRSGDICVQYFEPLGMSCFHEDRAGLKDARHLAIADGLPSDKIYFLGEDAADRLWVGTAAGVALVFDNTVHDLFLQSDGTPGDDSDTMAFIADPNGDVWMGTSTGLGQFHGARYRGPLTPPRSRIMSLTFGDARISSPFPEPIQVPAGAGSLNVRFTAQSVVNEARVSQELRVVGVTDAWHTAVGREERYGALGPGTYQVEVRARYDRGEPGPVAALAFEILPAWWQTWWARGAAIALFGGVIAIGVRVRLRSLSRRNEELSRLVDARTAELRTAQEKVVASEKLSALGRMLAQLSHELNNPVNVIANNIEPMRAYLDDLMKALTELKAYAAEAPGAAEKLDALWSELDVDFVTNDFRKALNVVATAAGRVRGIHVDLRTFMRGGAVILTKGDIVPQIREAVEMAKRGLPPGVNILEDYAVIPDLSFNAGQLSQVLMNLLNNAVFAVGTEGTVTVTAREDDGYAVIAVEDTGEGVPEAARARLFEPFFTTKDIGKGTGLGLSICREIIVRHHGGTIELDPAKGRGARFVVRLPLGSHAPPPTSGRASSSYLSRSS